MSTHDQQAGVKFVPIPIESGMGMSGIGQAWYAPWFYFYQNPKNMFKGLLLYWRKVREENLSNPFSEVD